MVTRRQSHAAGILQSNELTVVDTRNMGDDAANSTSMAKVSSNPVVSKPDAVPTEINEPEVFNDNDSVADEGPVQVRPHLSADEDEGNMNLSIRDKNLEQIDKNLLRNLQKIDINLKKLFKLARLATKNNDLKPIYNLKDNNILVRQVQSKCDADQYDELIVFPKCLNEKILETAMIYLPVII